MKRFLQILRPLVVLAVFVAAVGLLYHELKDFEYAKLIEGLRQIRLSHVALAIGLTALNYVFLFGYDFLAIRYIGRPLPLWKLAIASFVGHVASFNFGSLLGGSSVRYRFYSVWKFSALEILQLIAILGVTFWLGVCLLAGVVFLLTPFPIPEEYAESVPVADVRLLGVVLITLVAGYLGICAVRRRPLKLFGKEVFLPPPELSFGQILVSCADLMVAAAVFFVLLPADTGVGYLPFLGVFLLGMVVAAFTHVPGGLGVFDSVVLFFLTPEQALAPLLVFRGVYYLLPLVVAGSLLLAHEAFLGREFFKRLTAWLRRTPPDESAPDETEAGPPSAGRNRCNESSGHSHVRDEAADEPSGRDGKNREDPQRPNPNGDVKSGQPSP